MGVIDAEGRAAQSIEDIILQHSQRGMLTLRPFLPEEYCSLAAEKLLGLERGVVLLTTGFFVAGYAETDGPVGTYALALALRKLGFEPVVVTDEYCRDFFEAESIGVEYVPFGAERADFVRILHKYRPHALVSIERCGRNVDGHYANMRGVAIDEQTAKLDVLFELARERQIPTFGVGDGGNEIGMGNLREQIISELALTPCAVEVDYLVIASVSNWGAYGLCACLQKLSGEQLLPHFADCRDFIGRTVEIGSVDGVTHDRVCSVDGFGMEVEQQILLDLHRAAAL